MQLGSEKADAREVAAPAVLARHVYRRPAGAGEVRVCVISGSKRELSYERARHRDVAKSDAAAELRELSLPPWRANVGSRSRRASQKGDGNRRDAAAFRRSTQSIVERRET
jgi:hypothetical protein